MLSAPRLIDRGELLAVLDRAVRGRVTLISAPAGSGKTSLLREWADGPGQAHRLAFVAMQRDQNDAQQFWLAMLDAVRHAYRAPGHQESAAATPDFNARAMIDRVLSELAQHPEDIFLIFDDLHELTSPQALVQLSRLLADVPPNVHAILATRRDLQLGLHKLRLTGDVAEIRAADLRFTETETRALLEASGVTLSEGATALLHQRTEGWAAGLRLAVISLAGNQDPERFVAEFSGSSRTVAEYLLAEMIERQPAAVQQLLLRTSVLDRVNGELADLLTGRSGSDRVLLDLEDANAFVMSLDPERTWFRYHHLFADLLRLELRRTLPAEVAALRRLAAGWLAEHGQVVEAVRHWQAAGDWSDAARLLADHSFSMTLDGQAQTIEGLLREFPRDVGVHGPDLALARATTDLLQGRLDEAAAHMAVARASIEMADPSRQGRLRVALASLDLSLARRRGDVARVLDRVKFLDSPISAQSDAEIALDGDLRAVALMNLGIVEAWSMASLDSERHLQEGADLARKIGRPYLEVACLAQLAFASKVKPFATTRRLCREAIALAEQHGWGAEPILSPALVTLTALMTWTGELDDAEHWLQRTTRALETDSGPGIRLLLHLAAGMLQAGRGQSEEALAEFSAAERLQAQLASRHALASQLTGWVAATQARAGRPVEASASLARLDHAEANAGEIRNGFAAISLANGTPAEALGYVQDVIDGTAPVVGYVTIVEAQLLAALAHRDLGDQRATHRAVERALALAEPDRLVLPFAMTGAQELLEEMPRHETSHAALLADILDVLRGSSGAPRSQSTSRQGESPSGNLSPAELRVLRYLPTNLSRPEIAGELSVSLNTVNTHIRNVYAKLQATDRSSAVQRARELRLLSTGRTR